MMFRFTYKTPKPYFGPHQAHNRIMFYFVYIYYHLLEMQFLEHGDADLVVQPNFHLELFHPKFGDT